MHSFQSRLAIGAFLMTLTVAFVGLILLPPRQVEFSWQVWYFGSGYVYVSGFDETALKVASVKLTDVQDLSGTPVDFKELGHGMYRIPLKNRDLRMTLQAPGRSRVLKVSLKPPYPPSEVAHSGPLLLNCRGPRVMMIPVEGEFTVGLPNRVKVLLTTQDGQISPLIPENILLKIRSARKVIEVPFKGRYAQGFSIPISIVSPVFASLYAGTRKLCSQTFIVQARSKGLVLKGLSKKDGKLRFTLRTLDPETPVHCFVYKYLFGDLWGPLDYTFVSAEGYKGKGVSDVPERKGLYYLFCAMDPVMPEYNYVRRYVLVGGRDVIKEWKGFADLPRKAVRTLGSLVTRGDLQTAAQLLGVYTPDLIPRPYPARLTLKEDERALKEKRGRMATALFTLIGVGFAGIGLWVVISAVRSNRAFERIMGSEEEVSIQWFDLVLFVIILLVNLAVLLYTFILVYL